MAAIPKKDVPILVAFAKNVSSMANQIDEMADLLESMGYADLVKETRVTTARIREHAAYARRCIAKAE